MLCECAVSNFAQGCCACSSNQESRIENQESTIPSHIIMRFIQILIPTNTVIIVFLILIAVLFLIIIKF